MGELGHDLGDPDPRARLAALKGLLDRGDATACPRIAEVVPTEPHPKVRAGMVMVLGKLGGRAHAGVLAKLTADPDPKVRLQVVQALAEQRDPACYATLVRVMGLEREPAVRDAAAHFLMANGKDKLLLLFKEMIVAEKPWKREAVVAACQLFNSTAVVPFLKHAATKDDSPTIREAARTGLRQLASQGNAAAAKVEELLRAAEAPPPSDLSVDMLRADPSEGGLSFNDTYTGGRIPRVEMEDHFREPAMGDPISAPVKIPAVPPPPPLPPSSTRTPLYAEPPAPEPARVAAPVAATAPAAVPKARPERKPAAPLPFDGGMGGMVPPTSSPANKVSATKTRPCPVCGEEIAVSAKKCRFCNEVFDVEGLKQVQAVGDHGIGLPMPTSLSVITCLQYVGCAISIFGSFMMLLGGNAGVGIVALLINGGILYLVGQVRAGSSTAWTLMTGLMVLGFMSSLMDPGAGTGGGLIGLLVMVSPEVRAYCTR